MNKFFNETNDIVSEALLGAVKSNPKLALLDGLPQIKCVFTNDRNPNNVAILSGGGSGHEPSHAGYIGRGMLSGAIAGEVFASPSVDAVLAAILHVSSDAGCLLIVKNYTGDRLNFGLAAERAKNLGHKVEMIIVADDISIPDNHQPRGIAGTLFVHKMAGYYSELGLSLSDIKTKLDAFVGSIRSLGVAYSSCHLPGEAVGDNAQHSNAELGLGIHGEPGVEVFEPLSCRDTVFKVVSRLKASLESGDEKVAVLVNNLGATSNLEMAVVMNDLLESELADNIDLIFGPMTYMTALDMQGFSISVLPLNDELRAGLMAPVDVSLWTPAGQLNKPIYHPLNSAVEQTNYVSSSDALLEKLVIELCDLLIAQESHLNELDAKVGDGDTGTTFANGARAIKTKLSASGLPLQNTAELLLSVGNQLSTAMGGSSGVLLSIFFTSAGNAYASPSDICAAFKAGIATVSKYGGAKLGDRTMLDAAIPAIERLSEAACISSAAESASMGAEGTANMTDAKAGRSSYLRSDSLIGVQDPGAVAISLLFAKAADVLAS